ncbi:hypothetical protein FQZ97_954380 [compost metagenome]
MTAAAGRVAHGECQQRLYGLLRVGLYRLGNHRLQGALDELLDQGVGRVVAAGQLAGVALGAGVALVIADEGEPGGRGRGQPLQVWHQLEQTLVNASQLLGWIVAVVDSRQASIDLEPAELEHGRHEVPVLQLSCVEPTLLGLEQTP